MADLSIEDLLQYIRRDESVKFGNVYGNKKTYRDEEGVYGSPYYALNADGREYYLPVTISFPVNVTVSGSNSELRPAGPASPKTLQDWNLPNPLISIKNQKKIVETELTERRGTVKEIINMNDYQITVRGVIVNMDGNQFPENDVILLRTLYEQNVPLSIKCPLTDIFLLRPDRSGSDKVVIKSLDFPELPGVKNVRQYTLEMVSDEPFNLVDVG